MTLHVHNFYSNNYYIVYVCVISFDRVTIIANQV